MKIQFLLLKVFLLLNLYAMTAIAQISYDNWNFLIKAKDSQFTDSLATIGIRPDATTGFDNAYDIPRPPRSPSGNYLEVYFPHSGGNYPPLLGTKYAVDFQGPNDPSWNMSVESSTFGQITLSWDSSYVNSIEPRVQLYLRDVSNGELTNMRKVGRYSFTYSVKRDFQIIGAIDINLKYLMEGFWNGVTHVQDTISGYLAQSTSPFGFVDSTKIYLSNSGTGQLIFPYAPTGNYYLVIRHRNHLEIWSSNPLSLIKGTTSYSSFDFSTSVNMAFGVNALKQVGGDYVSWSGDVNQDGVVDFLDRNLTWNNRNLNGYYSTDCNGDNITNATDYSIVLDNRLKIFQRP